MMDIKYERFPTEYNKLPNTGVAVSFTKDNINVFKFQFSARGDGFCCGLYSLGSFYCNTAYNVTDGEKIKVIRDAFEKTADIVKGDGKQITLVFTLINSSVCNLIKEALADEKIFKGVKSYQNLASGNNNTLYINV